MSADPSDPLQDVLRLANAAARGKRPQYFASADVDRVMAIVMALAMELAVTRERLDTVERLLSRAQVLDANAVDAFRPTTDEARARGEAQLEYLARILRVLQQEAEALRRGDELTAEAVALEVAQDKTDARK